MKHLALGVSVVFLASSAFAHETVLLTGGPSSAEPDCTPLPKDIAHGNGVYIGETHGTREAPRLVLCLAEHALKTREDTIIVSLEMPTEASIFTSNFWQGQDGRASLATRALLADLSELSRDNPRLHVRFHGDCTITSAENINATVNTCYGENLLTHSHEGFLVAYGGNVHASRGMEPYRTSADYLTTVKTVNVIAANGGAYWNFTPQTVPAMQSLKGVSGFIPTPGQPWDYIYVLESFTLSPPVNQKQ